MTTFKSKAILAVVLVLLACILLGTVVGSIVESMDVSVVAEDGTTVKITFWDGFFRPFKTLPIAVDSKISSTFDNLIRFE